MIAYQHTPWGRLPLGGKDGRQTAIEVRVPDAVAALLAIVATHDRIDPEKFAAEAVARAVNERAETIRSRIDAELASIQATGGLSVVGGAA